jgi:two-component system cell cycle response regulator DivK
VVGEKIENGTEHGGIAQPLAQLVRREAGQREEALGAVAIGQDPAECLQRKGSGIDGGGRLSDDCQGLSRAIRVGAVSFRKTGVSVAKRILVVEDNDLNRKLFCDLLRAKGFEVEPVADGREAIGKTRLFMPHLVIMDIQLPNVSGIDLIEAIKADEELKAIPILAVTAYAGKGDEETIRAAGAEGYLAKPVSIGPFMVAVNALV